MKKIIKITNIISISLMIFIIGLSIRYYALINVNNNKLTTLLSSNHSEVIIYEAKCNYCKKILPKYIMHALLTFNHSCYLVKVNDNNRQLLLANGINRVPVLYHNGKYYYGNIAIKKVGF